MFESFYHKYQLFITYFLLLLLRKHNYVLYFDMDPASEINYYTTIISSEYNAMVDKIVMIISVHNNVNDNDHDNDSNDNDHDHDNDNDGGHYIIWLELNNILSMTVRLSAYIYHECAISDKVMTFTCTGKLAKRRLGVMCIKQHLT